MKNNHKLTSILNLLSGILFIFASIVGENLVFIPIGCCFIALGVTKNKKKDNNSDTK